MGLAKRHGIQVHAVVLMSTHEHLILSDPLERLPMFLRELHRVVALGVKVLRGWEGAVWDHERPSVVHLRTPQAVIEKLAYVMANPVAAGLVRAAKEWPGVRTLPHELGTAQLRAHRPRCFFDEHNPLWPAHAALDLAMPSVEDMTDAQIRSEVARELEESERQARAAVQAKGWAFMGEQRVRKASPYSRAKSWEPLRGRNPHFAVGKQQREAFFEAAATLRAFRGAYRDALSQWQGGNRLARFPLGTWLMRVVHGALTAAPT